MSAAAGPPMKTVSLDSRNRVVLPEPTAKDFLLHQDDDGSYHLIPSVPLAQETVKRIGKALKAMQRGEAGKEISAEELSELSALLEKQGF